MAPRVLVFWLLASAICPAQSRTNDKPSFIGGNAAQFAFFSRHIRYTSEATKANVSGKLYARFRVNQRGEVDSITLVKHFGFGMDHELKRVIQLSSGHWNAAKENGRTVARFVDFPVTICPE